MNSGSTISGNSANAARILVVDDELIVRESLMGWLRKDGHAVSSAQCGREALDMVNAGAFDLLFLDIRMPDMGGVEVLSAVKARYPEIMVVMITAFGSVESAVEAMKLGANDYLMKPFDPELLCVMVKKLIQQRRVMDENICLKTQVADGCRFDNLLGASECMVRFFSLMEEVAAADSPVLIRGETGTGKEIVARAIHGKSGRSAGPFVAINCGAFTETLLESELFGHEAGAFTGAIRAKKGRVEMAREGTLFLDEIGEIPAKMQVDLLRVIQEKRVQRVGGAKDMSVNFRLISATHRDLAEEIRQGRFRQDFYFRLNVIEIHVPPLRERREDIPLLARHFLERFRKETSKPVTGIHRSGLDLLESYDWPGNVRELENALERAVVLAKGNLLTREDFGFLARPVIGQPISRSLDDMERCHIDQTLRDCRWNISRAARILCVNRTTLHNKIRKYNLRPPEMRESG